MNFFLQFDNVKASGISSFKLIKTAYYVQNSLELNNSERNELLLKWYQDTEQLKRIIGLIEGLMEVDYPAHQYLTQEKDGLLIEIAYRERI